LRSEAVQQGYRLVRDVYPVLDGTGAARVGGRWNSPGREVVHASDSFALAMLEMLVKLGRSALPTNYVYGAIRIGGRLIEDLDPARVPGWDRLDDLTAPRAYGDRWLEERRTAVLRVPSVVSPIDRNLLINPAHPAYHTITVSPARPVPWDPRLFGAR
jgi:RES domain-containing protein